MVLDVYHTSLALSNVTWLTPVRSNSVLAPISNVRICSRPWCFYNIELEVTAGILTWGETKALVAQGWQHILLVPANTTSHILPGRQSHNSSQ